MESTLMDTTSKLSEYGILGIFMAIVLIAFFFTVRYLSSMIQKRNDEFNNREIACEARVERIATRLDNYIDSDHKSLMKVLEDHADAYRAQTKTNEMIIAKLIK